MGPFDMAEKKEKMDEEIDKEKKQQGIDRKDDKHKTTEELHGLFADSDAKIRKLAKAASIQLNALKAIMNAENVDTHRLRVSKSYLQVWKQKFREYCPYTYEGEGCDRNAYYRTADGTCNNLDNPTWGATFAPELREIPAMYDDGINEPRQRDRLGNPLPSARLISNIVHKVDGESPRNSNRTMMVMQWGQFIDHEFVGTPVMKGDGGTNIQCCGEENVNRTQCFPISIPDDDPYFKKSCMNFVRSAPVPREDCGAGFREQMNHVTSYIDGSAVYGSSENVMTGLRRMSGGHLKSVDELLKLLPKNDDNACVLEETGDYCMRAGDIRVNVVPSLGWTHTLFFRSHNRMADALAEINPHWSDETLFQQARRILAAQMQIINYKEYLPSILNKDTLKKYGLILKKYGYNQIYRRNVNPTIANVFAAAAFRFGHSQIADYQAVMNNDYKFVDKSPIEDCYHKPHMVTAKGGQSLDGLGRWLSADPAPLADGLFEQGTRNKLFMDEMKNSLDLPALNIQRGRDHGIPSYNHWRVHCHLEKAEMDKNGTYILPDHTEKQSKLLQEAYSHVDDIDLFAGAMTEILLPGSSVGPTFACLLGRQFQRIMEGDRYWHETSKRNIRFTLDQLEELRKTTLAKVMCENNNIKDIQPNVFVTPGSGNERVPCEDLPGIDLTKWKDCEQPFVPNFNPQCKR
ncbi:peroxidase-like [Mya arenaria]|uniref:peroxidase-like n=1 Tax=Mya arenaria TaxID=6604 RepID=UPI0022E80DE3|nr:peroxidase-like [Mya arenaria]